MAQFTGEVREGSRSKTGPSELNRVRRFVENHRLDDGSKSATARSADIREDVGYSGMQRGVCEYGIVPVERYAQPPGRALGQ